MKNLIIIPAICLTSLYFVACNNASKKSSPDAGKDTTTTAAVPAIGKSGVNPKVTASVKEMTADYLQLKNALTNNNSSGAAIAGKALSEGFAKLDMSVLTTEQKKTYTDIAADAKEMAEHIGKSEGNIPHQREHFDMLSKDMVDLLKLLGAGQPLYVDHCPMYNNKKGAFWLSESKDIKNPYMGSAMSTCGTIREELK